MSIPFLEIDARGSHREIGRQVGEAARELIVTGVAYYEQYHEDMGGISFAAAQDEARRYLEPARRWVPAMVEMLEGMAEASGVSLSKLLVPNCGEELTCNDDPGVATGVPLHHAHAGRGKATRGGHCTSLAIMSPRGRVVAHNEDWFAGDVDKNILVRATTPDGTTVLTMGSAVILACTGLNSHGIASAGNTVYCDDARVGVPNNLIRRWLLEARDLEEARDRCLVADRARGSNHLFGDSAGRIWDLETSATAESLVECDEWYAHTNHYVTAELAAHEISTSTGSRARLQRARELIAEGVGRGDDPRELAARVLCDHATAPSSICCHSDEDEPPGMREMTTASMIWDLDERTVDVCAGTPCDNGRRRFALD